MSSTNEISAMAGIGARAPIMTPMGPIPSPFTTTLLVVIIIFLMLATAAVVVRVYIAYNYTSSAWKTLDLWLIIAALLVTYGCVAATLAGAAVVGLNFISDRLGLDGASQFAFKVYFSDTITTVTASGLVKLSILEFYKRIFVNRGFKIMCYVMSSLVASWMIATLFLQIFSTTPISSAWHTELQTKDANYDYPTAFLAIFGIGMVLDLLVLCLPLRPIYKLQLEWKRKIKIWLVLWLGMFCVICAAVRFWYTYLQLGPVFVATAQQKGTITINAAMWSILEPNASIIAACLPTYGPLIKRHSLRSMMNSAKSYLSISSRRSSSNLPSKEEYSSSDQDEMSKGWSERRPNANTHTVDIEASSTKLSVGPTDSFIHATTEITVRHQDKS